MRSQTLLGRWIGDVRDTHTAPQTEEPLGSSGLIRFVLQRSAALSTSNIYGSHVRKTDIWDLSESWLTWILLILHCSLHHLCVHTHTHTHTEAETHNTNMKTWSTWMLTHISTNPLYTHNECTGIWVNLDLMAVIHSLSDSWELIWKLWNFICLPWKRSDVRHAFWTLASLPTSF